MTQICLCHLPVIAPSRTQLLRLLARVAVTAERQVVLVAIYRRWPSGLILRLDLPVEFSTLILKTLWVLQKIVSCIDKVAIRAASAPGLFDEIVLKVVLFEPRRMAASTLIQVITSVYRAYAQIWIPDMWRPVSLSRCFRLRHSAVALRSTTLLLPLPLESLLSLELLKLSLHLINLTRLLAGITSSALIKSLFTRERHIAKLSQNKI